MMPALCSRDKAATNVMKSHVMAITLIPLPTHPEPQRPLPYIQPERQFLKPNILLSFFNPIVLVKLYCLNITIFDLSKSLLC